MAILDVKLERAPRPVLAGGFSSLVAALKALRSDVRPIADQGSVDLAAEQFHFEGQARARFWL